MQNVQYANDDWIFDGHNVHFYLFFLKTTDF